MRELTTHFGIYAIALVLAMVAIKMVKKIVVVLVVLVVAALAFSATPWYASAKTAMGMSTAPASSEFGPTPYMDMNGVSPVRWSSCSPIRYEINLSGAPADAASNLNTALATLSRYTHLRFAYAGTTPTIPQSGWINQHLPAPLVIAWATPTTSSLLGQSQELSIGAVASVGASPGQRYVSGVVVIDSAATVSLPSGMETGGLGLLVLHELSHAIGLDHSHDPHSYMYPYFNATTQGITTADAVHLANLNSGAC
jgi:hypothetical protein